MNSRRVVSKVLSGLNARPLMALSLLLLLSCLTGTDQPAPLVHGPASRTGRAIDLQAETPVTTVRHGDPALVAALDHGTATALSLTAADLDGDGVPELVEGYALPDGRGALVLHHGNPDATSPRSPAAREALVRNERIAAFDADAVVVALPTAPSFLEALPAGGGQGARLLFATQGQGSVYAATGSIEDGLTTAPLASVPGGITALAISRAEGATRVVIGVHGEDGASVRVFEHRADSLVERTQEQLPDDATAIAVGNLDGDRLEDAAILAGGKVYVLRGSGPLAAVSTPASVRALELGFFIPDRDPRAQLALLDAEGNVLLMAHGDFQGLAPVESPRLRGQPPREQAKVEGFEGWRVLERFDGVTALRGDALPLLKRTRISDHGGDDLAIYDAAEAQLSLISHRQMRGEGSAFAPGELSVRPQASAPLAVVPLRLSADPRPGMALLEKSGLVIAPALTNATIVVNSTVDDTNATLVSNCLAGSGTCSLRAAVIAANQRPGADTITLPAGTFTLTLTGADEDQAANKDLDVLDALTLNGAGQASTIIEAGTTASNGIDKIFSINPTLSSAFATAFSNLTLRYGFNHSTTDSGFGYGGAFDWDATGTGTLSLTDCTVSDNQTVDGDGGGIFTSSSNSASLGGAVTLTNVTFSNNVTRKSTAGESGIGGALEVGYQVKLAVSGSTFSGNQAPQTGGEGGAIYLFDSGGVPQSTITGSTFSGNTAGFGGGAVRSGRGLDITSSTFTGNTVTAGSGGALSLSALTETSHLTLSTVASNSASVSGGGIYLTNGGPVDMHFNRVVLNTAPLGSGMDHAGAGTLTANENWWACNVDPSTAACGRLNGVTSAAVKPFLLVTPSASPSSVQLGDSVTVTGSMVKDSAGTSMSLANLVTLSGRPVAFNNPQRATLVSADTALSASFTANATLSATAAGAGSVDIVVDGAVATAAFTVAGPDLTISKTDPGTFTQGDSSVPYTIQVTNAGSGRTDSALAGGHVVTVTDVLPTGLTFASVSGTGWTCSGTTTVTCTLSTTLQAGQAATPITLNVNVSKTALTPIANTATVAGGGEEASKTGNNSSTDNTPIKQLANLTLTKTHAGSFRQGQTGAQYTLTVHNAGTGASSGTTTVVDTLPAGLTATAFAGSGWTCDLTTLTCSTTAVVAPATDFPVLTLSVNVAANATTPLLNNASVSGGGEVITGDDSASDSTVVTPVADLTVSKSHVGDFRQGQTGATYAIVVHNVGPGPTLGTTTLIDTLPAGLTATAFAGTGWSCTVATATCTSTDVIASGADFPALTLTVDVAGNAAPSITNSVTVSDGGELVTTNDSANDPTNVTQVADLTVTKSHAGNFRQGDTGDVYTLTVKNAGPGPTVGAVTLTDTLPAGLTATAMAGTGWTCTLATLQCTRSDALAAGGSYEPVTVTVDVALNAPASVTNSATVAGGGELVTTNDSASDPTTVDQAPDLTVTKSHTGTFRQGDTGKTYLLTVSNVGSGATTGQVLLTDALPTGLTATAMAGTGWTCTVTPLQCTRLDALAAGASYPQVTVTVDVDADAPASVTNTATVSGGTEVNAANDTATDFTALVQVADLTLSKSHVGDFTQGQTGATYQLVVHNAGTGDSTGGVQVTELPPAGLSVTGMTGGGWTCDLLTFTCTRADVLAATADFPAITVTVDVAANATTPVVNTAQVQGGGELNTANDSASDSTNVTQFADLTLTKSHVGGFSQGQTGATYTLQVHNAGAGATDGTTVTVTDTLPAGLTATAMTGTGWTCTVGTATCTSTQVIAGGADFAAITLTVDVSSGAAPQITNTATVAGGGELVTGNDGASDATAIGQVADLTVVKSHSGSFRQGQTGASYTLTVSNGGAGPTAGTVTLVDTLPAGLTATGMAGTGWTCDVATATCTRSDALTSGGSYPDITLLVTVAANAPTSVTNQATVSGGGEAVTSNDSASDPTTIVEVANLTISKTHVGNFTQGQAGAQYTVTVSNSGVGPTVGTITVQDTLPAGLTGTAIAGTGWTCDLTSLTCTTGSPLAAGAPAAPILVTVDVAANAQATVTNTATVSGGGELNLTDDTATDTTQVTQLADLTLSKSHTAVFSQGDTGVDYTLVVHNLGTGDSTGVVSVQDTLPTGLTATAIGGQGWTCTLGTLTCTRADALAAGSDFAPITVTVDVAANAPGQLTNTATVSGGGEILTGNDGASDPTPIGQRADLTLTKSHTGDFRQGQSGASYTLVVHNGGIGPTVGDVTVVDTLPAGLTATALSGTGWSCDLATLTCLRSDALAAGASYPDVTLTVDVAANAPASLTNSATVAGGGELDATNDGATDVTTIGSVADLTLTKTHAGTLVQGQSGVVYTLTVTNAGVGDTVGAVNVTDAVPAGLALTGLEGAGWSCDLGTATCTRSDVLAAGSSYPAISVTVDVSSTAPASLTNVATVSGGGELDTTNDSASDGATVSVLPDLTLTSSHVDPFYAGQQGAAYTLVATNSGGGATLAEVTVVDTLPAGLSATAISGDGWTCTLATLTCTRSDVLAAGASYPGITLLADVSGSDATAVNTATISGGGEQNTANDTASDPTVVKPAVAHGCGCAQTGGSADLALGLLVLLSAGFRLRRPRGLGFGKGGLQ